jgi:hypothetical protein
MEYFFSLRSSVPNDTNLLKVQEIMIQAMKFLSSNIYKGEWQ